MIQRTFENEISFFLLYLEQGVALPEKKLTDREGVATFVGGVKVGPKI
jgi:hypothetical protein